MAALRVLHLEDLSSDADLIARVLKQGGIDCTLTVIDSRDELLSALLSFDFDLVLSDHQMPGLNSFDVLQLLSDFHVRVPVILVTATTSEDTAVEIMKLGAWDYVRKDRLQRLPLAIKNALKRRQAERDREVYLVELQQSYQRMSETVAEVSRSHKRFEAIMEATNDALFEWDLVTGAIWWNESYFHMFGFDPAKPRPSQEEWLQRLHPADRPAIEAEIRLGPNMVDTDPVELRFLRHDGSYGTAMLRRIVQKDESGKAVKLIGSLVDVSYHKAMEQDLRLKEMAIASSISGIVLTRHDGEIIYANTAMARMWGYDHPETLTGVPLLSLFEDYKFQRTLEHILVLGNETGEGVARRVDGLLFDVAYAASVIVDGEGNSSGLFISFIDISERKEAETIVRGTARELSQLIQDANAFIVGIDRIGNITEWNGIAEQATGYRREEAIGLNFLSVFVDQESREVLDLQFESVHSGKSIRNMELSIRTRSGNRVVALTGATPRRAADQVITGALLVGQDITELSQYRASLELQVELRTLELNNALSKEKELVEMRSRFVSMASHEFRTPLSSIILDTGFIRRYKDRLNPEEINQKLDRIERQANHMTQLLNDVLLAGQIEAGKIQTSLVETDLAYFEELIQEIIDGARARHRLSLYMTSQGNILTDRKLVRNILSNLITNAIKFSPQAGEVDLSIHCKPEQLVISVRDHGIGIPSGELKNLFTAFTRASNVGAIDGTGLGLSIVRKAVDLMKGQISVTSEPGTGTEFVVRLPLPPQTGSVVQEPQPERSVRKIIVYKSPQ